MAIKNYNLNLKQPLEEVVSEAFGKYAKYIIQDRALPDVRDGLKPVQRRILYTAYLNNLTWKNPHRKSAKLVGDVMGQFHPHGDSSIYEAIVRMCQPWKTNIPLLNMHGNSGSIDGDPAAAMRYTEIRLTKVSEWLLKDLNKNTVNYIPNFDDTTTEPVVLPALFFNLLCNGASGIAAGYATNIPPYNPNELTAALIKTIDKNQELSVKEVLQVLPGPDFPTCGKLELNKGIVEAYETGKGKFFIYASYSTKSLDKIEQIIFHDIPYETNKSTIVAHINELIADNKLPGVIEIRDESDRNGISIVLDLDKKTPVQTVVNYLYKNTSLRISYNINSVVISDRKPQLMSMPKLLWTFVQNMQLIVLRSFKFDYQKLSERLEIVEGLIKALSIIDEVIRLIRRSTGKEDAKQKLMTNYAFTNNQAEAIVQLRLYKLSNTDLQALLTEKNEINTKMLNLKFLIDNDQALKNEVKKMLNDFVAEFGFKRRSSIIKEEINLTVNQDDLVVAKPLVYYWTKNQQFKVMDHKAWTENDVSSIKLSQGDIIVDTNFSNAKDTLLFFTNLGNVFVTNMHTLEVKRVNALGVNFNQMLSIALNESVVGVVNISYLKANQEQHVLLTTKKGLTKRLNVLEITKTKTNKGIIAIKLNSDDELVGSLHIKNENGSVCFLTKKGMLNHVLVSSVNILGRNSLGQRAIKLNENDEITTTLNVPTSPTYLIGLYDQGYKKTKIHDLELSRLANKGTVWVNEKNIELKTAFFVADSDFIVCLNQDSNISTLKVENLKSTGFKTKISNDLMWKWIAKFNLAAKELKYGDHEANEKVVSLI